MLSCHSSALKYLIYGKSWRTVGESNSSLLNSRKVRDTDISELREYGGTSENFVELQQCWFPEYYDTALEERFQVAIHLAKTNMSRPALFRLALSRDCIPKLAVHMRARDGRTLLHVVAWVIGLLAQADEDYGRDALEGMSRRSTTVIPKYL